MVEDEAPTNEQRDWREFRDYLKNALGVIAFGSLATPVGGAHVPPQDEYLCTTLQLSFNGLAWFLQFVVFFALFARGNAVTCTTCYDQIEGCTGGATCLLHTQPQTNMLIV